MSRIICVFLRFGVTCHEYAESPVHLFLQYPFAANFWDIVLHSFRWSFICPNSVSDALASLLVGHPFGGTKKMVWLAILHEWFGWLDYMLCF